MKNHSTKIAIVQMTAIIAVVELLIMALFALLPISINAIADAYINAALLAMFSAPIIYLAIVRPFMLERDKALNRIARMAHHDLLTDLPNRRFLTSALEKFLAEALRHKITGALMLIDLDGFKNINDTYGHDAGDAVLITIAKRLQLAMRAEDVVARLGGDEFTVLVGHLNGDKRIALQELEKIAENLRSTINAPIEFNGKHLVVGCSVGVTLLGDHRVGVNEAIREADLAMYRAKKAGNGSIEYMDIAA